MRAIDRLLESDKIYRVVGSTKRAAVDADVIGLAPVDWGAPMHPGCTLDQVLCHFGFRNAKPYRAVLDIGELFDTDPETSYRWRKGGKKVLPPVLVYRCRTGLYVQDGHHSIDWAYKSGFTKIAAWVIDEDPD